MNRFDRPRQALAVGLAALAGFVDAFGFLSADGYFVSFMSGNTTRLGVNVARDPALALVPALLILGFVAGVTWGAALARQAGYGTAMLAALVLAMGALNNTFQRDGEVAVGLTYMTGALVRLGQGIAAALLGRPGNGWTAYLLLWSGLALGAVAGALAFLHVPASTPWIAAVWAGVMAFVARRLPTMEPHG